MDKALQEFLNYKQISVKTKNRMDIYKLYVSKFLKSSRKPLKQFKETEVVNFLNKISKDYSIGTMNLIKSAVNSFCYWFFKEKYHSKFPNMRTICKALKTEKKYSSEDMLSKKDIETLVQAEHTNYWKAYWLIYFYGGFRPGEVCKLKWEDVIFTNEGCYIKVYVNKNHKTFEKYIPENVTFYLRKLQYNNSQWVFPTIRRHKHKIPVGDVHLTRSGVYQRIVMLSKKILNKKINPYILRHSIATILYNREDLKDSDVAQQMGHSTAMRETYNNLSKEKLRTRMKKLWIKTEDLPPEQKHKFEEEIEFLKQNQRELIMKFKELQELNQIKIKAQIKNFLEELAVPYNSVVTK